MPIAAEIENRFQRIVNVWNTSRHRGQRVPFMVSQTRGSGRPWLTHPGLSREPTHEGCDDRRPLSMAEIEELAEEGLIRLWPTGSERYQFEPTAEAVRIAEQARLRDSGYCHGVRLNWEAGILPVLRAAYEAAQTQSAFGFEQANVNEVLGRDRDDAATDRVLHELVRTGYVEEALAGAEEMWGPHIARLTEKGYQQVAGWLAGPSR